jgi:NAD(P)-dependent dehydrogenase (short-subunit alcohol dehydrogenase family)
VPYDLEDPESIEAAVAAVVAKWGRIDVFVANAVRWPVFEERSLFADSPVASWLPVVRGNTVCTPSRREMLALTHPLISRRAYIERFSLW